MTKATTPALLALACLLAMPSLAQARYSDGMNLYQYVKSRPTLVRDPAGLGVVSTHLCCKYRRVVQPVFGSPDGNKEACEFEFGKHDYPDEKTACKCELEKKWHSDPGGALTVKWWYQVDDAEWDECCWCRLYVLRSFYYTTGQDTGWPGHVKFLIECDSHQSAWGDFVPTAEGSSAGAESPAPVTNLFATNAVVEKRTYECDVFDKVWAKLREWNDSPPGYNIYHDCYWYVHSLMGIAAEVGYERHY